MRHLLRTQVLLGLSLLVLAGLPTGSRASAPASQDALVIHVLNRIGYGPRPGDVEKVRAMGVTRYLDEQLHPERLSDASVEQRLAAFKTLRMTPVQLAVNYPNPGLIKRLDKMKEEGRLRGPMARLEQMLPPPDERGKPRAVLEELAAQRLIRDVYSERQLQQVMVDFWLNHFNVFWAKGADQDLLTSFEMDVIRPRALGKFRDLLLAVAQSPAMLFYLDNYLSRGPDAPVRGNRKAGVNTQGLTVRRRKDPPTEGRGINENYGRELMELHTLGVDGGYTQKDVVEVARCLTGWTIQAPRLGAGFIFRPRWHDPGPKRVLGHAIPPGGGIQDGLTVIDILAHHPSTARFIATKLCRRFVADDPPRALVARVAGVFTRTDGDLRETVRSILTSPEFLSRRYERAKVKTPLELVVSAIRAVGADTDGGRPLMQELYRMGMPPYLCQPPTGYVDQASAWVSTGGLLERLNFAVRLMEGRLPGTRVEVPTLVQDLPSGPTTAAVDALVDRLLGGQCSTATRLTLLAAVSPPPEGIPTNGGPALERQAPDGPLRAPRLRRLAALLLGSPEFQRK